jgi:hypothetical protein
VPVAATVRAAAAATAIETAAATVGAAIVNAPLTLLRYISLLLLLIAR